LKGLKKRIANLLEGVILSEAVFQAERRISRALKRKLSQHPRLPRIFSTDECCDEQPLLRKKQSAESGYARKLLDKRSSLLETQLPKIRS
jgi:hypothetical protein